MIVALVAAVAMEPVAALAHRALMHTKAGWGWHRSHHQVAKGRTQRNDLFPLVFAAATIVAMWVGVDGPRWLFDLGVGVTLYGAAYALVHDVAVHGRLTGGRAVLPGRYLRWVAGAHAVHHRTGRAPYGFLVPIVPRTPIRAATPSLRGVATRARVEKTS